MKIVENDCDYIFVKTKKITTIINVVFDKQPFNEPTNINTNN